MQFLLACQEACLAVKELGGFTRGMLLVLFGLGQRCAVAVLVDSHVVFSELLQRVAYDCAEVLACPHEATFEVRDFSSIGSDLAFLLLFLLFRDSSSVLFDLVCFVLLACFCEASFEIS